MNRCDSLDDALARLREDYACREVPDDRTLLVSTGRWFADGDAVEVLVRWDEGGDLIVSDGGLVAGRLELADLDRTARQVVELWTDISADYGVREINGRVYSRGPVERSAQLIAQVADAVLALDTVRHAPAPQRAERFDQRVRRWLSEEARLLVRDESVVHTRLGGEQAVTGIVEGRNRSVVVMSAAGGGSSQRVRGAEHAFFVFSQLDDRVWADNQRLTVLGGRPDSWRRDHVASLRTVSYVASFERQLSLAAFLNGQLDPKDRDLIWLDTWQRPLDDNGS